jgi:hypothetical protein
MAIPASRLETWSHQGAIAQSRDTYATVKRALEAATAPYTDRNFNPFLQGSYGNDTNIHTESDVDIVIRYDGAFFPDLSRLPADQLAAYNAYFAKGGATYRYIDFKSHVQTALNTAFGAPAVRPGTKAIKIVANNSRRNADVVVAYEYRRYYKFISEWDEHHDKGIGFLNSAGTLTGNFPNQHSENLTTKHQATGNRFKPIVRIFKNMRTRLVENGTIAAGIAPSYYIEGLLYNVPNVNFVADQAQAVYNVLYWLATTVDRTNFVCANERYYLLRDNDPVCWPIANGPAFINAVVSLWDGWR